MTKSNRMRAYVSKIVRRMPPDLTHQLAELERAGKLDVVLEQFFTRYMATRLASEYAAGLLRAELAPLLPDVAAPLRTAARTQYGVIEKGTADVVRVTTQHRSAAVA